MAKRLLDLKTDLTSLKYGFGEKPYITKPIGSRDYRGDTSLQTNRRLDDLSRITQMLANTPGAKYLRNEALLTQVDLNKRLKEAAGFGAAAVVNAAFTTLGTSFGEVTRVVGSTLQQVPELGTGIHYVRGSKSNTYLQPTDNNPGIFQILPTRGLEGAPLALEGSIIEGSINSNFEEGTAAKVKPTQSINRYTKGNIPVKLKGRDIEIPSPDVSSEINYGETLEEYTQNKKPLLQTEGKIPGSVDNRQAPSDIRQKGDTFEKSFRENTYQETYQGRVANKETRVGLGDQGARNDAAKRKNQYWKIGSVRDSATDRINATRDTSKINLLSKTSTEYSRDLIKFRFSVITPDNNTRYLHFRAYLDSFNDNFNGQWNPVKYIGRGENFYVYSGFERKISLSFKIAASTRQEMGPLYDKITYLASTTAPTYGPGGQFMRGTLTGLTVGDYVYELPGFISSITYTWEQDYSWDIALENVDEPAENTGNVSRDIKARELPMMLNCSIEFVPIHTFTPQTGKKDRFIGQRPIPGPVLGTEELEGEFDANSRTQKFNNTPATAAQTDNVTSTSTFKSAFEEDLNFGTDFNTGITGLGGRGSY